jgi:hypothetical protein
MSDTPTLAAGQVWRRARDKVEVRVIEIVRDYYVRYHTGQRNVWCSRSSFLARFVYVRSEEAQ